jgi:hypothetical protein
LQDRASHLKKRGGLALIAVGGSVDPLRKYINQLTPDFFYWTRPQSSAPTGWEDFFWHNAYGCSGSPPSDAPTIGSEPTITFQVTTPISTPEPVLMPCDGRIALFLDTSKVLSDPQFEVKLYQNYPNSTFFRNNSDLLERNFSRTANSTAIND